MDNFEDLLKRLVNDNVSDIHLKVKRPPLTRVNGELNPTNEPELSIEDVEKIAKHILGPKNYLEFQEQSEYDTSFSVRDLCRFRVNVFKQRGTISLILRIISYSVPSIDDLGVPAVAREIALEHRGLVLVTGTVGSGKSSTLAAMIKYINETARRHVVTLEDPIEFLHRDKIASINQREISVDTKSFKTALKGILRQDPDVILIGEMRDMETMSIAMTAAESGHLIFSTLHTADAKETINRIIDAFPASQEKQIRIQLAGNLKAVISQRLLETADGKGRCLAAEVMIVNAAIRDHIIEPDKSMSIMENMAKGRDQYGSVTFDQSLMDLYKAGKITKEVAIDNATSKNDFKLKISLA